MRILSIPAAVFLAAMGALVGIFASVSIALSIVELIPLPSVIAFEIAIVIIGMVSGFISRLIAGYGGKIRTALWAAWNIGFCAGASSRGAAWLQTKQIDADTSTIMATAALVFGITVAYMALSGRRRESNDGRIAS